MIPGVFFLGGAGQHAAFDVVVDHTGGQQPFFPHLEQLELFAHQGDDLIHIQIQLRQPLPGRGIEIVNGGHPVVEFLNRFVHCRSAFLKGLKAGEIPRGAAYRPIQLAPHTAGI